MAPIKRSAGFLHSRSISRVLAGGLSDADKKSLLENHTKPITRPVISNTSLSTKIPVKISKVEPKQLKIQNSNSRSQAGPSSSTVPAKVSKDETNQLKRSQAGPSSSTVPAKVSKVETNQLKRSQAGPSSSTVPAKVSKDETNQLKRSQAGPSSSTVPAKVSKVETNQLKRSQAGPSSSTVPAKVSKDETNQLKRSQAGPSSSTVPAKVSKVETNQLKRSQAGPSSSTVPAKVSKLSKKQITATTIAPYDNKVKFKGLLEKYRAVAAELRDLKEENAEISDQYEEVKETAETSLNECNMLKIKLLKADSDLKETLSEFGMVQMDLVIRKYEIEELHRKNKLLEEQASSLLVKLMNKCAGFDKLKTDFDDLTSNYNSLKESLQNLLAAKHKEQRELRNTIQDLKGNIRVYCRVRPPLESEISRQLFKLSVIDACSLEVEKVLLLQSERKQKHLFCFDGLFTRHSSQADVFAEVSAMVQSALDGSNVCIFAYGPTGSGKTFTMEGDGSEEHYGIIPRAFNMIFTCMGDMRKIGWELTIKASFLEIYNEIIYDLLNFHEDQEIHEIKMVDSEGSDIYVSNLKEEMVKDSDDYNELMMHAQRNRHTAAKLDNERSSRSHSVTQIKISAIHDKGEEKYTSNLNFVDLAGSESGKTTQRMHETKHINTSLSELARVLLSLQTNQSHIPYRNSKLTHLLMPSLGGNSKTLMLVNIKQFDDCFSETLNALRFAAKFYSQTIKPKKNVTCNC